MVCNRREKFLLLSVISFERMVRNLSFIFIISILSFSVVAQQLTTEEAISAAVKFIKENGYTNDSALIKSNLDYEFMESKNKREKILQNRFNSLKAVPIGARREKGKEIYWYVAFDLTYDDNPNQLCRVVSVNNDGSIVSIEHQMGTIAYFKGFE